MSAVKIKISGLVQIKKGYISTRIKGCFLIFDNRRKRIHIWFNENQK